jgi:hypothetical protein
MWRLEPAQNSLIARNSGECNTSYEYMVIYIGEVVARLKAARRGTGGLSGSLIWSAQFWQSTESTGNTEYILRTQ